MTLRIGLSLVSIIFLIAGPTCAQSTPDPDAPYEEPIDLETVELEQVRLIILDTLVLDSKGRTVPGLEKADFEILLDGEVVEPDTLDVDCDTVLDDPRAVRHAKKRERPTSDGAGGRIVLAFDYLHLPMLTRARVLDHAKEMVRYGGIEAEEIMVVALNGALRVEQAFSADRDEVWTSLRRMQYDITLWQPSFFHATEDGWVRGLQMLFDVLGTVEGRKAVVFFSAMHEAPPPLGLENWLKRLAAQAATSRCSVYPVDARGLLVEPRGAGPQRGAEET